MSIDAALLYWQAQLRLGAWTIELRIERAYDMPTTWGECICHAPQRYAVIRLRDPDDIDPNHPAWATDIECTLVHELLHVAFYEQISEDSIPHEQALNAISEALVRLRRESDAAEEAASDI